MNNEVLPTLIEAVDELESYANTHHFTMSLSFTVDDLEREGFKSSKVCSGDLQHIADGTFYGHLDSEIRELWWQAMVERFEMHGIPKHGEEMDEDED